MFQIVCFGTKPFLIQTLILTFSVSLFFPQGPGPRVFFLLQGDQLTALPTQRILILKIFREQLLTMIGGHGDMIVGAGE